MDGLKTSKLVTYLQVNEKNKYTLTYYLLLKKFQKGLLSIEEQQFLSDYFKHPEGLLSTEECLPQSKLFEKKRSSKLRLPSLDSSTDYTAQFNDLPKSTLNKTSKHEIQGLSQLENARKKLGSILNNDKPTSSISY